MSIKQNGGVFGRNPTFNDVTIEGDLIINGEVFTGLDFQGSWNASTNSPTLASSTGTNGEFYIVSVAGTTNLNGITNWGIGDWAIFNGTAWQRVEGGADGNFNALTANTLKVDGGSLGNTGITNCDVQITRNASSNIGLRTVSNGEVIRFVHTATDVGSIDITTSATSYNTSSDYRLKEDVQPMSGATDRLKELNPVNFAWKVDGSRVDGFLAHEAQDIVPECVTGAKDATHIEDGVEVPDYQGIDQSKLVPLLVATIQELEARITALEA